MTTELFEAPAYENFDEAAARAARDYDAVPYTANPFPQLHPARLAAVAHMYGLATPPVASARILDIGCAAGGHIIPLAAAFPQARVVGLDVSARQIEEGQARIGRLGLTNIEMQTRSLTELGPSDGTFDYIVSHGVYSWIPAFLRSELLRVCKERLAPNGLAVVSYNVFPGWRMYQVVRDCLNLHAGAEPTHEARAAQTRRLLSLMAESTRKDTSYGSIWRNEAQRMAKLPDAYLAHEIFEENNHPSTFRDFVAAVESQGLAYLNDAAISAGIPDVYGEAVSAAVKDLAGDDVLETEQYIDIVTGRGFRQSILAHPEFAVRADRSAEFGRVTGLHVIAPYDFEIKKADASGEFELVAEGQTMFATPNVDVAEAMERVKQRLPSSVTLADIVPPELDEKTQAIVSFALMRLIAYDKFTISTEPVICADGVAERPKAWFLAASDVAAGAARTVTLRHSAIDLEPLPRFLLPLVDGTRTRDELTEMVIAQAAGGVMRIDGPNGPITDPAVLRGPVGASVDRCLRMFARTGLLVAD